MLIRRSIRTISILVLLIASAIASAHPVSSQQASTPEQRLAEKYAPIAALREQEEACDRSGEAYFPAPVELLLGNPEVTLKRDIEGSSTDEIVMQGPTAQDLAGLDTSYYLDLPGDPNNPGCTYETSFRKYVEETGAQPTAYAHLVVDDFRGRLILQYWFWYYFDDWNNTHESDWEMVQLVFEATSAAEALDREPVQIGFAQHGGGELASWNDDKLARDGDRIIVHPAVGSHATYFGNELYIGWGENGTGFGCDNTLPPVTRVPLDVVLLPDDPDPGSTFAWLLYDGRWGEQKGWEYDGPPGPNTGFKWLLPIRSSMNWRDTSLAVPASQSIGPTATDLFCSLSAGGSRFVTRFFNEPVALITVALAIIGVVVALFVTQRQQLREALRFYRQHLGTFAGIGAMALPIGIIFNGFAILVRNNPPMEWVVKWFNDTEGARLSSAATVGGVQQITMILLVAPPIIVAVRDILDGKQPGIRRSFRQSYSQLGVLAGSLLLVFGSLALSTLAVISIPVAIWLSVRWQFFSQATLLGDSDSAVDPIHQSSDVVAGHWWHVLGETILFQLFSLIPGPLIGVLLLLLGRAAVDFANGLSSVLYAITIPISIIGLTLAYERYRDSATSPASKGDQDLVADAASLQA